MRILFTGNYEAEYNRTAVILAGLKHLNGVELLQRPLASSPPSVEDFNWADVIFLPSFTHADVRGIRKRTNKPLIFDPLISKYLTKVFDYKQVKPYSPRAYKNYLKDKRALDAANVVLADTRAHANYFTKKFKVPQSKIEVLYIGADTSRYQISDKQNRDSFKVGFYGGFIPLQGVEKMLEAAKLLKSESEIEFELLGDGFEFDKMKAKIRKEGITNVKLRGWIEDQRLDYMMNEYDVCLGIFGESLKSDLVIPNKLYHYAAKGIPFITKRSVAVEELFTDQENCMLCEPEPREIANAIVQLKNDSALRKRLGQNAYSLISEKYDALKVAEKFVEICKRSLQQ